MTGHAAETAPSAVKRASTLRISGIIKGSQEQRGGGRGRGNFGTVAKEFRDSLAIEVKRCHNPHICKHTCTHTLQEEGSQLEQRCKNTVF